jgi:putative oxidoreductase
VFNLSFLPSLNPGVLKMAYASEFVARTARALPQSRYAHWFLRLPLAAVALQQGAMKFPLSADAAAGFGLPLALWALAALGEIAVGVMLLVGGLLRRGLGDLITRLAGAGLAVIVAGVIYVAYWAPPLDLLMFNQFQLLLLGAALYLALVGDGAQAR